MYVSLPSAAASIFRLEASIMVQCVAMWCSMLQCVAASILAMLQGPDCELQGVSCVAGCCRVLQCVAKMPGGSDRELHGVSCVAVCCSVLQCVTVCCSVSGVSDMYWINTP